MNAAALWLRDFPTHGLLSLRLTGHCLHSTAESPGLEKKEARKSDKRQMSSRELRCSALLDLRGWATVKLGVSSPPGYEDERATTMLIPREAAMRAPNSSHPRIHSTSPERETNRFITTEIDLGVCAYKLHICLHDSQIQINQLADDGCVRGFSVNYLFTELASQSDEDKGSFPLKKIVCSKSRQDLSNVVRVC